MATQIPRVLKENQHRQILDVQLISSSRVMFLLFFQRMSMNWTKVRMLLR